MATLKKQDQTSKKQARDAGAKVAEIWHELFSGNLDRESAALARVKAMELSATYSRLSADSNLALAYLRGMEGRFKSYIT